MIELEAGKFCNLDGSSANMYPNINFGDYHVSLGLNSPTSLAYLTYRDSLEVGYGLRGSLVHRVGMYIRSLKIYQHKKDKNNKRRVSKQLMDQLF